MADHMRTELVADALKMAAESRGGRTVGIICQGDCGAQYMSGGYMPNGETLRSTSCRREFYPYCRSELRSHGSGGSLSVSSKRSTSLQHCSCLRGCGHWSCAGDDHYAIK